LRSSYGVSGRLAPRDSVRQRRTRGRRLTAARRCLATNDVISRANKRSRQLAVRVSDELLAAIDAEVERLRAARAGARVQRSDAVREILFRALLPRSRGSRGDPPARDKK